MGAHRARRRRERRVLVASLAISGVAHVALFSVCIHAPEPAPRPASDGEAHLELTGALRVIAVMPPDPVVARRSVATAPTENRPLDERLPDAPETDPAPVDAALDEDESTTPEVERTADSPPADLLDATRPTGAAAALQPRLVPELWRPAVHRRPDAGAAEASLRRRLDAVEANRLGAQMPDAWAFHAWVTEDAKSSRWGAAPGVLYVAGLAVPLCSPGSDASDCGFGLAPGLREEYRRRLEVLRGLATQQLRGAVEDRADSIRARLNTKRDSVRR